MRKSELMTLWNVESWSENLMVFTLYLADWVLIV